MTDMPLGRGVLAPTEEQIRRLRLVNATADIFVRPGDAVAMVVRRTPTRVYELSHTS